MIWKNIYIPKEIRKEAFDEGDTEGIPMEISCDESGNIILKPCKESDDNE